MPDEAARASPPAATTLTAMFTYRPNVGPVVRDERASTTAAPASNRG
jgi:hypothetical protein